MVRSRSGTGGLIAVALAAAIVSGTVVVLSAVVADRLISPRAEARPSAVALNSRQNHSVNRQGKTDASPLPAAMQPRTKIKSVEVVGIHNASIVYRDGDGNILFRTEPLANVTVVSKNVDLPQVTIRETIATEVERMEMEHTPVEKAAPPLPPNGCESAFAQPSPESLTRMSSRCVTRLIAPSETAKLAAIR